MFKKIMKGGHRKPSKSDATDPSAYAFGPPGNCNSGSVSTTNVVVNHASRPGPAASGPNSNCTTGVVTLAPPTGSIEPLPLFRDVPASERQNLFIRKLQICCYQFDFSDTLKSAREKEIKRQTLLELVDVIQSGSGKITETCQEEMIRMISVNIFRCLPPAAHENTGQENADPEEDEPYLEPSWPHLQLVYELLLRYVVSSDTDTKIAKRYIDHSFVLKLLDLFNSEDPREREYLKTILHRIYGKFMVHRPFIRKAINNIFYRFIYETERHSGVGELLEILGSIINGFALPMKEEHKLFLVRALIPLHKPKSIAIYHQQLSYCITQFVEKDFKLADTVVRGLLKYWPLTNCQKEVLFLGELEEVLEATQSAEFQRCMVPLFRQIARCLNSSHFQVAERALFLWNNEHIVGLIAQNRGVVLPIIFEALEKNIRSHWNQAVHGLTVNVRKMFMEMDIELFEECQRQYTEREMKAKDVEEQRELAWKRLADVAAQRGDCDVARLVTGVVLGVRGRVPQDGTGGQFHVEEVYLPSFPPQHPLPEREESEYVALVSGLSIGRNKNAQPLRNHILVDYLAGRIGDEKEREFVSKIVRTVVVGNVIEAAGDGDVQAPTMKRKTTEELALEGEPLKNADELVSTLAAAMCVDLMPGASDPSNYTLPQQSFHPCLFPRSSHFKSFRCVTNPYEAQVGGVQLFGDAGQPLQSILQCTLPKGDDDDDENMATEQDAALQEQERALDYLQQCVEWRHAAPTAPDILACFPMSNEDPFILETCPHVYFSGNQPRFSTRLVKGTNDQQVRLITVPSFSETSTIVIVDLKDLSCFPIEIRA